MRHILSILAAACFFAAPASAQTLKSLMVNTSNNQVAWNSSLNFADDISAPAFDTSSGSNSVRLDASGIAFGGGAQSVTRTNLGLGADADVKFLSLELGDGGPTVLSGDYISFPNDGARDSYKSSLGLGATNIVTFAGLTNNGDIRINQTTPTNGLLYAFRTNNEPFLGLANLIASNNTTVSNETLFRVGRAEATSQSAQFGFRIVRTNNGGEGFAVFSVFGYNALMMIGPSDRSRTNTATNAAIEADIWTINQTNRVMTLRDTNTGALTMHQELGFSTGGITTNAPANTTNVALWLRVWVGTNNYRLPLYQ